MFKRSLSVVAVAWLVLTVPASAQEAMEFEPVPPESVAAMERRRLSREAERLRREARRIDEEAARTRAIPPVPPTPPVPPVPELSHAGDVVRIGSDIHIEKDQVVEGDVFALQGDIEVDGHVKGNVAATGGDVRLGPTARVDGDVMCIGGQLEEEPGAQVGGQRVTALRGREARRADRERERERGMGRVDWDEDDHDWKPAKIAGAFSWLLLSLLLAWAITRFAATRTAVALSTLKSEPGLSLLLGIGLVFLVVPSAVAMALVVAILCITIIGIPLALGVLLAYAGLLILLVLWGSVVGATPIGERLAVRFGNDASSLRRAAIYGVLAIAGLRLLAEMFHVLPFLGWFASLLWVIAFVVGTLATMMGAGALIRSKLGMGVGARWWPLWKPAAAVPATVAATPPSPATPPPPPSPPPPAAPGEASPAS